MEHYLLHLSYSQAGWNDIIEKSASFDDRLEPARKLVAKLGGSFASFHFYDTPHFHDDAKRHVVRDKFAMFGSHDLMAVVAFPDKTAAQAFSIAATAQPGIAKVELTILMPFEEAVTAAVKLGKDAMATTGYSGPGSTKR